MNIKPPTPSKPASSLPSRFWQWLVHRVADEVPADVGLCEFDCRKLECSHDQWEHCERRLSDGAGELFPLPAGESSKTAQPAPEDPQAK